MGRRFGRSWTLGSLTLMAALAMLVVVPAAFGATTLYVNGTTGANTNPCSETEPCLTINHAVSVASAGDTIQVAADTYDENVTVDRALTIQGAGAGTVVRPGAHNPDCAGGGEGSLCGGGPAASVVFLIKASNVTITDLKVDGNNPALAGSGIDARDGIETDTASVYNNLNVDHVTVQNIYLRGIYASSGGTFSFDHNTVEHVSSDLSSIGIFNYEGAGSMTDNVVNDTNDAIASNHSRGVTMTGNTITDSGSGLHTDNAGDGGGVADVIANNSVSGCKTDGYGIWVFVPYIAPSVHGNTVTGCAVGLGAFGGKFPSGSPVTTVFSHNSVDGTGALVSSGTTTGAWLDTTTFGWGNTDNSVQLTANTIRNFDEGVYLSEGEGANLVSGGSFNRIVDNPVAIESAGGTVGNFENNWWGCNAGPNNAGCGSASGPADLSPRLVLGLSAVPNAVWIYESSTLTADLTHNSAGEDTSGSGTIPDGTTIGFTTNLGSVSHSEVGTSGGKASVTLTSTTAGTAKAKATLDSKTVETPVIFTDSKYASEVMQDNPLGYWRLGDALEISGLSDLTGNFPGEYKNGAGGSPQPGISGDNNTSAYFVGNGQYGYIPSIPAPTSAYTMEAWVQPSDEGAAMIMQHGGSGALYVNDEGKLAFVPDSNEVHLQVADTELLGERIEEAEEHAEEAEEEKEVEKATFIQVVGTWDGTTDTATLYVNGEEVESATSTKAPSGAATLYIGYGTLAPWFRGFIDEAAYYPTALGATRIEEHYAADPPPPLWTPRGAASGSLSSPAASGSPAPSVSGAPSPQSQPRSSRSHRKAARHHRRHRRHAKHRRHR